MSRTLVPLTAGQTDGRWELKFIQSVSESLIAKTLQPTCDHDVLLALGMELSRRALNKNGCTIITYLYSSRF